MAGQRFVAAVDVVRMCHVVIDKKVRRLVKQWVPGSTTCIRLIIYT